MKDNNYTNEMHYNYLYNMNNNKMSNKLKGKIISIPVKIRQHSLETA